MIVAESEDVVSLLEVSPWQPELIVGTEHAQKMHVELVHLQGDQMCVTRDHTGDTGDVNSRCLWERWETCSDRASLWASLSASLE